MMTWRLKAFLLLALIGISGPIQAQTDQLQLLQGDWTERGERSTAIITVAGTTITIRVRPGYTQFQPDMPLGATTAMIVGPAEVRSPELTRFPARCFETSYSTDCNVWLTRTGGAYKYYTLTIGGNDWLVRPTDKSRGFM